MRHEWVIWALRIGLMEVWTYPAVSSPVDANITLMTSDINRKASVAFFNATVSREAHD